METRTPEFDRLAKEQAAKVANATVRFINTKDGSIESSSAAIDAFLTVIQSGAAAGKLALQEGDGEALLVFLSMFDKVEVGSTVVSQYVVKAFTVAYPDKVGAILEELPEAQPSSS